ncbi:MAG: MarR family winged helix-turn-helix transcriptional regulator [Kineosporiaceae bacterium]
MTTTRPRTATATTVATVATVATELVRLRRATESFRHLLGAAAGVDLEVGAMSALFTVLRLGPQRPTDLARALALDPSTTSRHVSALIRRGYAHRVPDPADGRAHRVEATDAGLAVHARVAAHRDRMLAGLVGDWPEQDLRDLARLLARFNDTVEGVDVAALARRTADPSPSGGPA